MFQDSMSEAQLRALHRARRLIRRWGPIGAVRVGVAEAVTRAYRHLFLADARENRLYAELESRGYTIERAEGGVLVCNPSGTLFCRRYGSDLNVFRQTFVQDELSNLFAAMHKRGIDVQNVVDAGANIGATAVRIHREFPRANIIAVEPDSGNFSVLQRNAALNAISGKFLKNGLWSDSRRLYFDRSFRDRTEWSITMTEEPKGTDYVDSLSVSDIIARFNIEVIDLLKIDIEGGERYIFDEYRSDLSFLARTRVIAIEIHDEFQVRPAILSILTARGFEIAHSGEYVVGFNSQLEAEARPE